MARFDRVSIAPYAEYWRIEAPNGSVQYVARDECPRARRFSAAHGRALPAELARYSLTGTATELALVAGYAAVGKHHWCGVTVPEYVGVYYTAGAAAEAFDGGEHGVSFSDLARLVERAAVVDDEALAIGQHWVYRVYRVRGLQRIRREAGYKYDLVRGRDVVASVTLSVMGDVVRVWWNPCEVAGFDGWTQSLEAATGRRVGAVEALGLFPRAERMRQSYMRRRLVAAVLDAGDLRLTRARAVMCDNTRPVTLWAAAIKATLLGVAPVEV